MEQLLGYKQNNTNRAPFNLRNNPFVIFAPIK